MTDALKGISSTEFAKLSPNEQMVIFKSLTEQERISLIEKITGSLVQTAENIKENDKQIQDYEHKIKLLGYQNFDHSNIILVTEIKEGYYNNYGYEKVNARCHHDRIDLFIDNWSDECKTAEYIGYVLNHESIHAVIDKILYEDDLETQMEDCHFPYFAGEIDRCFELTMSEMHREMFMDIDAIRNMLKLQTLTNNINPDDFLKRLGWRLD